MNPFTLSLFDILAVHDYVHHWSYSWRWSVQWRSQSCQLESDWVDFPWLGSYHSHRRYPLRLFDGHYP